MYYFHKKYLSNDSDGEDDSDAGMPTTKIWKKPTFLILSKTIVQSGENSFGAEAVLLCQGFTFETTFTTPATAECTSFNPDGSLNCAGIGTTMGEIRIGSLNASVTIPEVPCS